MSSLIRNVGIGKSLCDVRLLTTGVHTCIAIIVCLSDNTTFIYHISPVQFDIKANDARKELQLLIEETLLQLNKRKEYNSSLQYVYIIGGLYNKYYHRFNTELCLLKANFSTVLPMFEQSNVNDLRNFIKCIEYSNIAMNIDGKDDNGEDDSDERGSDEDDSAECNVSKFISDLTIISDRTSEPPILCIAQYFGQEEDLCGGLREVKPWIIYMFDFMLKCWHVFDRHPSDHMQSSYVFKVLNEFKHDTADKLSNNDLFSKLVDQILDNVIMNIKH